MRNNLNQYIEKDIEEFESRIANGEKTNAILTSMLRRIYKQQEKNTIEACSNIIIEKTGDIDLAEYLSNANTLN